MPMPRLCAVVILAVLFAAAQFVAAADSGDVPSQDLVVKENQQQRYFLIGPGPEPKSPAKGFGLILVLPGGDGSDDFHPFVKRIYQQAVPDGFLVAQLVAPKWDPKQEIVWPTEKNQVAAAKFTTEQFIDAVIGDVEGKTKLNPEKIYTLSWSSGGPAAYSASLTSKKIRGSFVAMSVFTPWVFPPLAGAKGHAYYIYHSPEDQVCPFAMAEVGVKMLEKNQAKTKLVRYEGGHGWHGDVFDNLRSGFQWLQDNAAK